MVQMQMPIFTKEVTLINPLIGFCKRDNRVYYFNGQMPLFFHDEEDTESFKMFMAQLYIAGNATQAEINRTFGLNPINMKRWVKKYNEKGPGGFYKKELNRKPRVMIPEILQKVQALLSEGYIPSEAAEELDLKADTIRKAIREGRLQRESIKKKKK